MARRPRSRTARAFPKTLTGLLASLALAVLAAQFGHFRPCWRTPGDFPACVKSDGKTLSGRACCQAVDPLFEAAHNDLFNLVPAVGEVNGKRSDFNWGMIPGEQREFGLCNFEVDSSIRSRPSSHQSLRLDLRADHEPRGSGVLPDPARRDPVGSRWRRHPVRQSVQPLNDGRVGWPGFI